MFISWNEQRNASAQVRAINKSRVRAHVARVTHQRILEDQTRARSSQGTEDVNESRDRRHPGKIIAWKGNSDPFRSQRIEVTPRLNEVLAFLQDVWIPATHTKLPEPFPSAVRTCFCTTAMIRPLSASEDKAVIESNLLPTASALAVLTKSSSLDQHSALLKASTIASLRQRLNICKQQPRASKHRGRVSDSVYMPIDDAVIGLTKALFITAVIEGNQKEAESHGKILQWLLRCQTAQDGFAAVHVEDLCQALGYELVRMQLTATPSVFDINEWVPACVKANSIPVLDELAAFRQHVLSRLDHTARNTPLEGVFLGTHQCFKLWTKAGSPDAKLNSDLIWNYVTLSNVVLQLQADNYSLRVEQHLSGAETANSSLETAVFWRIQACLAYSVLLWQLTNIVDVKISSRSYWPRGSIIANALREHVRAYHTLIDRQSGVCDTRHHRALLFVHWTGATWRRKNAGHDVKDQECFFYRGLFALAVATECHCAEDVKAIVESFLPSIHMRPRDWDWLDLFLQRNTPSPYSSLYASSTSYGD